MVRDAARALGLPPPEEYRRSAERPNLLIRIGDGSPQTPRLMLVGHLNIMPPGNFASWQTDPCELTSVDGGRVEIALAGPPHDWVPPSSAAGATRLIGAAATALRSVLGAEPPHGLLLGVTDSC